MPFRYKSLEEIKEQDLQELVDNKVSEAKHLDYKRDLPSKEPKAKREFLADVSSFANAAGGHLIYGIDAKRGVPTALSPISTGDSDADILRLEDMIFQGIRPRITGIETKDIQITSGGHLIIIRIPRSWNIPHMVTFNKRANFYSRTSRGKHQLDVDELRTAFMLSEDAGARIKEFRMKRIESICIERTPVRIGHGPKLVLHLVPMGAFGLAETIDIKEIMTRKDLIQPMGMRGCDYRPNFDGYLAFYPDYSGPSDGYTQVFRNGCIESVRVMPPTDERNPKDLDGKGIERWLLDSMPSYLQLLGALGTGLPILIMISLLGVEGHSIVIRTHRPTLPIRVEYSGDIPRTIDRENLLVPEIMVESYGEKLEDLMRISFDTIWNAAGWTRSMGYDEKGKRESS